MNRVLIQHCSHPADKWYCKEMVCNMYIASWPFTEGLCHSHSVFGDNDMEFLAKIAKSWWVWHCLILPNVSVCYNSYQLNSYSITSYEWHPIEVDTQNSRLELKSSITTPRLVSNTSTVGHRQCSLFAMFRDSRCSLQMDACAHVNVTTKDSLILVFKSSTYLLAILWSYAEIYNGGMTDLGVIEKHLQVQRHVNVILSPVVVLMI